MPDSNFPRHQCLAFMQDHASHGEVLPRAEFDALAKSKSFAIGPFRDAFGDGHGEPYNPRRQAFGKLKDGRCVYCELSD